MVSSNMRDLLTSFNPSSDLFAISSGEGPIKIWDTLKGQVKREFPDLIARDVTNLYAKIQSGHPSLDYSCMKWLLLEKKKKKEKEFPFLAVGTASGDVLALEVTYGDLLWRFTDCHSGGVNAISFSTQSSCIYSAGVDGMVCRIDYKSGRLLEKFKASTKAISSMAISSDGKLLATAGAELNIFSCSNKKKIQNFSGHTVGVGCMIFTEDSKYLVSSSGVGKGEGGYIAMWKVDGRSKRQSASCVLSMEHPAVFLHSKSDSDDGGLYVLAISELGVCYVWYGKNIEELGNAKPTKISLSSGEDSPMILAAELQVIVKPGAAVQVLFAYGSLVKPSFEKKLVELGIDLTLNNSVAPPALNKLTNEEREERDKILKRYFEARYGKKQQEKWMKHRMALEEKEKEYRIAKTALEDMRKRKRQREEAAE